MKKQTLGFAHCFIVIIFISSFTITNNIDSQKIVTQNNSKIEKLMYNEISYPVSKVISNSEFINISLVSPLNNSINVGNTPVVIDFLDQNGSHILPVTNLYRWDNSPNAESVLRPLPYDDGEHRLEVQVESSDGEWNYATYIFYSDNKPHSISLVSPENVTYQSGGSDMMIWDSSYASSTLTSLDSIDLFADDKMDIIAGGGGNRLYAYNGRDGVVTWLSPTLPSSIDEITTINSSLCIIGLSDGSIKGVNAETGAILWTNLSVITPVIDIQNDSLNEKIISLNRNELRVFNHSGAFVWNDTYSLTDFKKFLLIDNIVGDSREEIVVVSQLGNISIYDLLNGTLLFNYSLNIYPEHAVISSGKLFLSTSLGYIKKYYPNGTLIWSKLVAPGHNIYQMNFMNTDILCSTGNGEFIRLNSSGYLIFNKQLTPNYIRKLLSFDFDNNTRLESIAIDSSNVIYNIDSLTGSVNWNHSSSYHITDFIYDDFNGDSYNELAFTSTEGNLFVFDVRASVPKLVPSWTNVSIQFQDEISGSTTVWEKYSWDGGTNQSYPGTIPTSSGIHTLNVWVSDNASNIAYAKYLFYATINLKLNSPVDGSFSQSGTPINLTFSETPLDAFYRWDLDSYSDILTPLPSPEIEHELSIVLKDQSNNVQHFSFSFICDDTPISQITLLDLVNDTLVEGGEEIEIVFSETPHIEYYSWDDNLNQTVISQIPVPSDTHTLDVYVSDEAENWYTKRYVFHTKIKIDLTSHENDSLIDPLTIITIEFGENPDYYEYKIDDDSFVGFSDHNNSINITLPSLSSTHSVKIRVNDSSNGIWNDEIYVFRTRLIVYLISHNDSGFAETGDPLIVAFSDTPTTKLFSWDGQTNSSRDPVIPGPDGTHTLDVYLGNQEGEFWHYRFSFNVDTDLIDIILNYPTNNTRINSWNNLSISFSEIPFIETYQWDNDSLTYSSPSFPATDGIHILSVSVLDEASNVNSKKFVWIIDDTPINVSLNSNQNGSVVISGEFLNISFNYESPLIEWYQWDGGSYSPSPPPIPWKNGTHSLNISVSDGLNWNILYFEFNVTDFPPEITLLYSDIPYQSLMPLSVNVSEELAESWHQWDNESIVNGLDIVTPNEDGIHTITLYCKDLGGSYSFEIYDILIDNTPIKFASSDPSNNSIVIGGENVSVQFDELPYSISYAWNNLPRENSLSTIPIEKGWHILNIKAYDRTGNLLEVNLRFKIQSEQEKSSGIILALGSSLTVAAVILVIFRSKISTFLKNRFTKPRQIED